MKTLLRLLALSAIVSLLPAAAQAHCDTLNGPVVAAARTAFAQSDVTPVLKWVQPADEAQIKAAFARALGVRRESPGATELAETWFFETLVRVHRAGEGATYTGLKPAGEVEPGVAAADRALESGHTDALFQETVAPVQAVLAKKLERVRTLKPHADESVAAGRAYVAAYVDYVHFAERIAALGSESSDAHEEHGH